MSEAADSALRPHIVERAIRLSYVQAMLGSIYAASTGGMFIIGYALSLGANNAQIGLMSTIPMLCVIAQLLSSMLVERGISRRSMTIAGALLNVAGWPLVIMLPYTMAGTSSGTRVSAFIAIITLAAAFAHIAGNARASWVGDLIPSRKWGAFFGRIIMYSGIVGAVFALVEGAFLDHVKNMGVSAFSWLFVFGMMFGLINAVLFVPQADIPLTKHRSSGSMIRMIRETFTNGPLMAVTLYAGLWSMQAIAGPFIATYMLRDLKMPFLGVGIVNAIATVTVLASSPFWGRIVDRYGCRPVIIACSSVLVPIPLVWIWVSSARAVYWIIGPINLLTGFAAAGISVALSTLIYKVTPSVGRSVQLAVYSITVVLLAAPMPAVGGQLTGWLESLGLGADLRWTFYAAIPFCFAAAWAAHRIHEPDARPAAELMNNLPGHLYNPRTLEQAA